MPPAGAHSRRNRALGTKSDAATTFLAGISLRGDTAADRERDRDGSRNENADLRDTSQGTTGGDEICDRQALEPPATPQTPSQEDLIPSRLVQRSTSTPSLAPNWPRTGGYSASDTAESTSSGRRRKGTSPGDHPARDSLEASRRASNATKNASPSNERSPGLLSTLFAHENDQDARTPSAEAGTMISYRHALQRTPSRWLGPLSEHVQIKPLITSGTAHIVKKIFRRPSINIPKHVASYPHTSGTLTSATSRQSIRRASFHSATRLKPPQDTRRHIFYNGGELTNSGVSLSENLNQHAYLFTTKHGSPLAVSSILRYNDDKVPNKRRRRRFDREYLQQITKEALVRKKANSFAHLLSQSNALSPDQDDASSYDPYYLDDPELKTGKNRTVISLACYMGSVIQYTRPSDLKRELNEHFRSRHPTIDPSITLSKIRKVKSDLLAISEELDLEISTAALAYAYLEKLILKGNWKGKEGGGLEAESTASPVTKENRKLMACVCLLLAYKVNEPKRSPGEFTTLMKHMSKHMDVSAKDIKEHEFQVFGLLDFNLYLPRQEFLPHFEQILYRQDYLNVQEYLGEDEFYSVNPQTRKAAE
ncbi:CDK5 and ABL1 enzyme substrate 1 [Dissophora globulifera]|uniref:CDK5 and ABL1 enzyme substrate 1 n=1 Tax=Dissophora globulifera TaxID=979702 RepID=A0A9P6R8U5_9FUNG|nr:CDK5 and ABL1 enzyme substrate 1 [Dissophora globulifera]